tara:strand:+ start:983 stop:1411 length:429 start_codon:yes stop_codon:yes gene_type:complete
MFNSELAMVWSLFFMAPFFIFVLSRLGLFSTVYGVKTPEVHYVYEPPASPTSKEEQWDAIVSSTMQSAMQGDRAARDWVTKHVFTDPVIPDSKTSPLVSDAVDALKHVGYKASDVRKIANELCSHNDYSSLEDLIQDIIKNC